MAGLGLVLVLIAVAAGAVLATATWQSSAMLTLTGPGDLEVTVPVFAVFAAGAAVVVVAWLGLRLMVGGFRRKRARKQQLRETERELHDLRESEADRPSSTTPPETSTTR